MAIENIDSMKLRQFSLGILLLLFNTHSHGQTLPIGFLRNQMNTVVLTSGSSWTVPSGVTNLITVECWGAGGGSAGAAQWSAFGAGGGGAYAKKNNLAVT